MPKPWYTSKTLWVAGLIVPAGIWAKNAFGIDLPPWAEPIILAAVATILRIVTKEPISLS